MADKKVDCVLSNGREISFDLMTYSQREYRQLLQSSVSDDASDKVVARAAGMTPEEVADLSRADYKLLLRKFFDKNAEPLDDPN